MSHTTKATQFQVGQKVVAQDMTLSGVRFIEWVIVHRKGDYFVLEPADKDIHGDKTTLAKERELNVPGETPYKSMQ